MEKSFEEGLITRNCLSEYSVSVVSIDCKCNEPSNGESHKCDVLTRDNFYFFSIIRQLHCNCRTTRCNVSTVAPLEKCKRDGLSRIHRVVGSSVIEV